MNADFYDIIVIGAGPAGMAAALAASEKADKIRIALIEREQRIGGILKQCIHDGFGIIRFNERLTGPEYAHRYSDMIRKRKNIDIFVSTFVTSIQKTRLSAAKNAGGLQNGFELHFTNSEKGAFSLRCTALICATGCRERTDRQIFVHGERPAGVFTAGQAQAFINLKGYLPGKRYVILGSGDIGLIMARRLSLESAESGGSVEGVYEVKSEPSGLTRNVVQCLEDYGIPLHLSTTVTRLHGKERLEGVSIAQVDNTGKPVSANERYVPCDTLILSVGLIPENDILDNLMPLMDERTKGPAVNQYMQTSIPGLFSCGNALHVNDLVDYVSESGRIAGERAAAFTEEQSFCRDKTTSAHKTLPSIPICADKSLLYQVPARIEADGQKAVCFFRSAENRKNAKLVIRSIAVQNKQAHGKKRTEVQTVTINGSEKTIFEKKYALLKPAEMERFELRTDLIPAETGALLFTLEETA